MKNLTHVILLFISTIFVVESVVAQNIEKTKGVEIEDWETGDMSQYDWETGGSASWFVTDQNPYEGIYCAKSGVISHNQSSWLSLVYEAYMQDTISFWFKVSSEGGWDYFKFYIDNVEQDEWSGEVAWQQTYYIVNAGTHTFKWEYDKDGSVNSGSDCAWIDYIRFPVSEVQALFASSTTEACVVETVEFTDLSTGPIISWEWTFEGGVPATSTEQNPSVTYSNTGIFDVSLIVTDGVEIDTIISEDYITASDVPGTAAPPSGLAILCGSWGSTVYSTTGASEATSYDWVLDPTEAGTINGNGTSISVLWTDGFSGDVTLKVAGVNFCGMGQYSIPIFISVYLPDVTLEPFDDVCEDEPAFELTGGLPDGGEYSGPGVTDGWFDPAIAGAGTHTITYSYTDPENCENSAEETIYVDPCTGLSNNIDETNVKIFPNPSKGSFSLQLHLDNNDIVDLRIVNSMNEVVFYDTRILNSKSYSKVINLENYSKGLYYLHILGKETNLVKKIILQ